MHRISLFVMSICLSVVCMGRETHFDEPPYQCEVLSGYDENAVILRFDESDLQPLEGLWYYPDEVMTVAVERFVDAEFPFKADYRVVLLHSENESLIPGTVIGYLSQSAKPDKLRFWLYSEQNNVILQRPQKCVATLSSDGKHMTFSRTRWDVSVRINFARFLPTLFKGVSVVPHKTGEEVPEGFQKIYPNEDGTIGQRVRYL